MPQHTKRHFSTVSKAELRAYAFNTNEKQRSPELRAAWRDMSRIKELRRQYVPVKRIAEEYGVSIHNIYRILKHD